jgi:hypothetical protein
VADKWGADLGIESFNGELLDGQPVLQGEICRCDDGLLEGILCLPLLQTVSPVAIL